MKFLRRLKSVTRLYQVKNEEIRTKLAIYSLNERMTDYCNRQKQHLAIMSYNRISVKIQIISQAEGETLEDHVKEDNIARCEFGTGISLILFCNNKKKRLEPTSRSD